MLIRELPADERPRERLFAGGSVVLSDVELLSLLLRSGRRGISAVDLAREVLEHTGGLLGLVSADPQSLIRPGLAHGKLAVVLASVELGRRLARSEVPDREPLSHPASVARYLALRYSVDGQEIMGCLYLDTKNRLVGEGGLFRGALDRVAVEPRTILRDGLLRGAAGMVVFHTHPSGDPSPSAEDLAFTRRMAEAGEVVGIKLVDHLILGSPTRWVSLKERGGW